MQFHVVGKTAIDISCKRSSLQTFFLFLHANCRFFHLMKAVSFCNLTVCGTATAVCMGPNIWSSVLLTGFILHSLTKKGVISCVVFIDVRCPENPSILHTFCYNTHSCMAGHPKMQTKQLGAGESRPTIQAYDRHKKVSEVIILNFIPGYEARFLSTLFARAPQDFKVSVEGSESPVAPLHAWMSPHFFEFE